MTFRAKLLAVITLLVAASVGLAGWAIAAATRESFAQLDAQRTAALVEQFRRAFQQRGAEIELRVAGITETTDTLRMAIELARDTPDYALYETDALGLSRAHRLDYLEMVAHDGTVVSSAHWRGRFGSRNQWVLEEDDWNGHGPFLMREEHPDGSLALALVAVRTLVAEGRRFHVIGGRRLDRDFLETIPLPEGMRALLYRNLTAEFRPEELAGPAGPVEDAARLEPLIAEVRRRPPGGATDTAPLATLEVRWSDDPASEELFHALPLYGRGGELLGALLVGSSRRQVVELLDTIRTATFTAGGVGVALGILLSWWAAARVTRPVERLARMTQQVAAGDWSVRAPARSGDEVGDLARAFNYMTAQLAEQRERLLAAERVAAWRELARRLAHELKNPLFPLQITVENLERARQRNPEQFDEVFRESCATLLAEIEGLKTIVERFSDFARMPRPQVQPTHLNDLVRETVRLFSPQFSAGGRPPIVAELYLDEQLGPAPVDADLVRRALHNLVLNAMEAMPAGGTLTLRTARLPGGDGRGPAVRIEVEDTGAGLTPEECARLFTPYYTSKGHGTGLGLAIVQSVVSDHGGKVSVESEPGRGTRFRMEFPLTPAPRLAAAAPPEAEPAAQSAPVAEEVVPPAEEAVHGKGPGDEPASER